MKLLSVSLILAISLWINPVFAESICFDKETSGRIVVEIERGRLIQKAYELSQQGADELEKQLQYYDEMIRFERMKTHETEEALKVCQEGLVEMKKLKTPSLFEKVITNLGFVGLGALLILLL